MAVPEIETTVKQLAADELNLDVSEVADDTNISTCSDNLVMKFEEVYDIVIPPDEQDFQTVHDAVVCIDNILNGHSIAGD